MVIFRSCADNLLWGYGLCRPPTQIFFFGGGRPPCPPLDYARVYKLWPKAARGQLVSWERHSQFVSWCLERVRVRRQLRERILVSQRNSFLVRYQLVSRQRTVIF